MNQNASKLKILIICSPLKNNCFIREALKNADYEIFEAQNSRVGIRKTMEYTPDLIICQNEMDDYSGFQIYNLLKNTLNQEGILFFIYSDNFDKEDILIGLEMGVDNFIVSPVDEKMLVEKIERRVRKVKQMKTDNLQKFRKYLEATPIAKFVAVNQHIDIANQAFYDLLQVPEDKREKLLITDIFNISENAENARNYKKCMHGFIEHCRLNGVSSNFVLNRYYDIYLSYNSENGKGSLFAEVTGSFGNLINGKDRGNLKLNLKRNKKTEKVQLSRREDQVLEYSASGLPIKLIAEQLELSVRTVEKHRANIMRKTKTNNIIEAIYVAREQVNYG